MTGLYVAREVHPTHHSHAGNTLSARATTLSDNADGADKRTANGDDAKQWMLFLQTARSAKHE